LYLSGPAFRHDENAWAMPPDVFGKQGEETKLEIALLHPIQGVDTLVQVSSTNRGRKDPFVVEWPCGLGRVVLLATDVDLPPFSAWKGVDDFWGQVTYQLGMRPVSTAGVRFPGNQGFRPAYPYQTDQSGLANSWQNRLEEFED